MVLFLDRLPLHSWVYETHGQPVRLWSVSVPALPTAAAAQVPPEDVRPQRWLIDTACTGEGMAWRPHLQSAGLSPAIGRSHSTPIRTAGGHLEHVPVRKAAVWLFSNIPALSRAPFRLALSPGLPFMDNDFTGDPELSTPLIGVRPLLRAGLKVKIDFARATVSVWTPGPWYRGVYVALRRTLSGYTTLPASWSRP